MASNDDHGALPYIDVVLQTMYSVRQLACGRRTAADPLPSDVSVADVRVALQAVEEVETYVVGLARQTDQYGVTVGVPLSNVLSQLPSPANMLAELHYGLAVQDLAKLRRFIDGRLGGQRSDAERMPPIALADIQYLQYHVFGAEEILRVLRAEIPVEYCSYRQADYVLMARALNQEPHLQEGVDFAIGLIPFVGWIYDVGSGIHGETLYGRHLTNFERVMRIGFGTIGAMAGLIARGVRVVSRTAELMKAGNTLLVKDAEAIAQLVAANKIVKPAQRSLSVARWKESTALVGAVGRLPAKAAEQLAILLATVAKGSRTLEHTERLFIFRMLTVIDEVSSVGLWGKIADNAANVIGKIGHVKILKGVTLQDKERRIISILARTYPGRAIIALPRQVAQEFGRLAKSGAARPSAAKAADLVFDTGLADMYQPITNNLDKVLNEIASKTNQGASTVIVDLSDTAGPALADLLKELPRLWGRPNGYTLRQVLVVEANELVHTFARPAAFDLVSDSLKTMGYTTGGVPALTERGLEALVRSWDSLD